MRNFQAIFSRFMSIVLILTGSLLLMKWMQNSDPQKDVTILLIAVVNLVMGLVFYGAALQTRRAALKALAAQDAAQDKEDI